MINKYKTLSFDELVEVDVQNYQDMLQTIEIRDKAQKRIEALELEGSLIDEEIENRELKRLIVN